MPHTTYAEAYYHIHGVWPDGETNLDEPDSDINESPVEIQVKYTCGHIEAVHLIAEDLEWLVRNSDGTYTDLQADECAECLEKMPTNLAPEQATAFRKYQREEREFQGFLLAQSGPDMLDILHDQVNMREELEYWERIARQRQLTDQEQEWVQELQRNLAKLAEMYSPLEAYEPNIPLDEDWVQPDDAE